MKYESAILKRLIDTYGVVGNPHYISEIIKEFIVQGKECYPDLFTYQADWLAHIDEFGLTPEYTVSYTGQHIYAPNTKEKAVKSAILKGQTKYLDINTDTFYENFWKLEDKKTVNKTLSPSTGEVVVSPQNIVIEEFLPVLKKPFKAVGNVTNKKIVFYDENKSYIEGHKTDSTTVDLVIEEIPINAKYMRISIALGSFEDVVFKTMNDEIFGVPNLELQSVKMPVLTTINGSAKILTDTYLTKTGELSPHHNSNKAIEDYILIPPMDVIVSNVSWLFICFYDENKNFISDTGGTNINKFELNDTTIPDNAKYFRFHYNSASLPLIRFVNGTDYIKATIGGEPFKTNILTVNEEVELRGIGGVKDELNLLTGEVTERIGEIVLNEDITGYLDTNYSVNGYSAFRVTTIANIPNELRNVICDKVKYYPNINLNWGKQEEFFTANGNLLFVKILSTKASNFEELRTFLSSSPITIQYELAESIKTVELTIHDKDQQKVERLASFEGGTHFTTSSQEGSLLPSLTVDVVTNLEETLKVCSLEGNTM